MTKPTILLDVDGVICDFVGGILTAGGSKYKPEDITEFDFLDDLDFDAKAVIGDGFGFCMGLKEYPGASAFVDKLKGLGSVIALTAPFKGAGGWIEARELWLKNHMGIMDVIHCPTEHKKLVDGSFLIEDNSETARYWGWHRYGREPIIIDRRWSYPVEDCFYATNYERILDFIRQTR
jgi:hypothetical protein